MQEIAEHASARRQRLMGPRCSPKHGGKTERILQVKPSNRFELGFSYSVSDSPIVGPSDLKKLGYIIVPR